MVKRCEEMVNFALNQHGHLQNMVDTGKMKTNIVFTERAIGMNSIITTKAINRYVTHSSMYDVDPRHFCARSFPTLSGRTESFRIVTSDALKACRLLSPLQASEGGSQGT